MKKLIPSIVLSILSYPISLGLDWISYLVFRNVVLSESMLPCLVISLNTISLIIALYFLLGEKKTKE